MVLTAMNELAKPIPFDPHYEVVDDDEAETVRHLNETLRRIRETTYRDGGCPLRSVHAKSHGLLRGELQVLPDLPVELCQGLFAAPGRYPVAMRFSTVPGDLLDDRISTPRGLAIKVSGVSGPRLPGSEHEQTQDFVLVTGPAFGAPNAKKFLSNLKLLAGTTDKAPGLKRALSAVLRGTEHLVEAVGGESSTLKALGGYPETHILGETFYSQAPLLYGNYMAKISVAPVAPALVALAGAKVDLDDKPDGLRAAVVDYFASQGAEWEVRVQLCTDLDKMPIEDASVAWPEAASPYRAVARITAPAQAAWTAERVASIDEGMSFSPWQGLASHRPLGSVMRARRETYAKSAAFRADHQARVP